MKCPRKEGSNLNATEWAVKSDKSHSSAKKLQLSKFSKWLDVSVKLIVQLAGAEAEQNYPAVPYSWHIGMYGNLTQRQTDLKPCSIYNAALCDIG